MKDDIKDFIEAIKTSCRETIDAANQKQVDKQLIIDRAEKIDVFIRNIEILLDGGI